MDKDNKAAYRAVELGPKLEGLRIVRSGLARTTALWSRACSACATGSPVTPEETPMASEQTLAALAQQRQATEASNPAPKVAGNNVKVASARAPRG